MPRIARIAAGFSVLAFLSVTIISAQGQLTENTKQLDEGATGPAAKVTDFAWLAGHWQAEALGGTVEEIWSGPSAGTMVGMFRLVKDGKVGFYEIFTLTEEGSTVLLRLKHFDPDLSGWEERDETVDFPLVALTEDTAWFEGLTYQRLGPDEMQVYLAMRTKDGVREVPFSWKRVPSD